MGYGCSNLPSEREPSRKLDQARCSFGCRDLAEARGVKNPARAGEDRVIPDVKEIGCEFEIRPFGDAEVLSQRNIPVLLERPAKWIATEVTVAGGSIHSNGWCAANSSRIKPLIDATLNTSMGLGGRYREARIQRCRCCIRAAERKRTSAACVDDCKRSSRLEGGDPAQCPTTQERTRHAFRLTHERKVPVVTQNKPVSAIEIRRA